MPTQNDIALIEAYLHSPQFLQLAHVEYGKGFKYNIDWQKNLVTFQGKKKMECMVLSELLKIIQDGHIDN